ncbi:uncharacterized protein LOC110835199 isoform X2 [Zootermopsis nevadensis]|uniref:uncharacterized protein LOC110835199 isoform X2 n=1 Tax=Zootermopsis nevadensis TaxID=136037 RepID=UPI000B8EC91D|nr:uncharacterized protein LOC110835199 isoform X2 [Zootermopsis nevadensis]XP_021930865.1 uncharacterized protein LOC110835199 isoform X2 [Zootermopsis nevadensis]
MAVRLRQCCCGCSLKEGTIVVGILSLGALACGVYYKVKFANDYSQKHRAWYNHPEVILPTLIFEVVLCVAELVTSSLLLRGVIKYDRRLVMPWLVGNAMMCGLLFLVVVGGAITCFIVTAARISDDLTAVTYGFVTMVCGAIAVGVYVYLLLVVYSFYCLLPMLSSERIAILLDRFKNPYVHHTDESDHATTAGWSNITAPPRFSGY